MEANLRLGASEGLVCATDFDQTLKIFDLTIPYRYGSFRIRMRKTPLVTGNIYHIFNRGVNKQSVFFEKSDFRHFLEAATHYKIKSTKFSYEKGPIPVMNDDTGSLKPRVEILAYCLMPNHFHFLIKQLEDSGVVSYMRHLLNSYVHYINVKHKRIGPLFAGRYKNVLVESDEQLIHISRYIHLNPLVSGLTDDLDEYLWSSYACYISGKGDLLCEPTQVLAMLGGIDQYRQFVDDQANYGKELEKIKHIIID